MAALMSQQLIEDVGDGAFSGTAQSGKPHNTPRMALIAFALRAGDLRRMPD